MSETFLGEELPAAAREVTSDEAVGVHDVDAITGNNEDAGSSSGKQTSSHNSDEALFITIKQAEKVTKVSKTRRRCSNIFSLVDRRTYQASANRRPYRFVHNSLVTSLGWPPSLLSLVRKNCNNPLITNEGNLEPQFSESFLSLCKLQYPQIQRQTPQLLGHNGNNNEVGYDQPLWAIEDLVKPISVKSQTHFSKWGDEPKFIFALVYEIGRYYVDSMDELLQALVDQANLKGFSCREEWISSMVTSLSTYIAKEIFPTYINENENVVSLLDFIDLMIVFDKNIKRLVEQSGIMVEDVNVQKISCLSVFCDREDWLNLWGELELKDAIELVFEDDNRWSTDVLVSRLEKFALPAIATGSLRLFSIISERCRSLPSVTSRAKFMRLTVVPIVYCFLCDSSIISCHAFIGRKCEDVEGLTNDALINISKCINGSRYLESFLKERCEDVFFLEMSSDDGIGIFDDHILELEKFRTVFVKFLAEKVFDGFHACAMSSHKHDMRYHGEGWAFSKAFISALDYLLAKMSILEMNLNEWDFVGVWRCLASELDEYFFLDIFGRYMGHRRYTDEGVESVVNDFPVFFRFFKRWCLRPEGFFGKMSEGLRLLKMKERYVEGGERWLKVNGIKHLSVEDVERVAKIIAYGKSCKYIASNVLETDTNWQVGLV